MLFFLITCFSFIFFYKSLPLKPLPPWASEMRLIFSFWFWKDFLQVPSIFIKSTRKADMAQKKKTFSIKAHSSSFDELSAEMCVLDLPDLALDCILEKLPPEGLLNMASVCSSLRDRCISDHLWKRHMQQKWGRIISPDDYRADDIRADDSYREWQRHIVSRKDSFFLKGFLSSLSQMWPISLVRSSSKKKAMIKKTNFPPADSVMSLYLAIVSGNVRVPAQVYNRENGHVGFMLSCYDAELSYDARTDTFRASYAPHGSRAIAVETGVTWDRLRAPPVKTPPHNLHISDCLSELQPGDHIEIQWRRNKEFPYGWWYGVVGHLETCEGNSNYCRCHQSDTVILEFNQYTPGSRWRTTTVSRKDHREEGNEADGFYGGIRKLQKTDEISTWRKLWPAEILE